MNDEGVYKTAPATTVLLNMLTMFYVQLTRCASPDDLHIYVTCIFNYQNVPKWNYNKSKIILSAKILLSV